MHDETNDDETNDDEKKENKNENETRLVINFGCDYNGWINPNDNISIHNNLKNEIINKNKVCFYGLLITGNQL